MKDLVIDCLIALGDVAKGYKKEDIKESVEFDLPLQNNFGSEPCFDILESEHIPAATRKFLTGLKDFYDQQGYLSASQLAALERTGKSLMGLN